MIQILTNNLPEDTLFALREFQTEVDRGFTFRMRRDEAKRLFALRNRPDDAVFKVVRSTLDQMCCGPRRCMYCEDSAAHEIEHFRPKSLYPGLAFVWENYLYSCGGCNRPKGDRFAVFSMGGVIALPVGGGDPTDQVEFGDPLLIDPRCEDPLQFLILDLKDTFLFQSRHPHGSRAHERAKYTIEILRLNDREYLRAARRNAYVSYCGVLHWYVSDKRALRPQANLERKKGFIQRNVHPTVWHEMKRQRQQIPELKELFALAPEALHW